jgi:hypothetical protein
MGMQPEPVGPAQGPFFFWPGPSTTRPAIAWAQAGTTRCTGPCLGHTPGMARPAN